MDATDIGGFEGDQSQQGQGLAYVLPQSRTVGYFMQLANEQAQQRRADAALLQHAQQKANEQYAQHLYEQKTPEIANQYTQWLQPKFDQVLKDAADYHAQTGQDAFTNPNFVQRLNDLNTVAKSTHQANLTHTAYATQIADKSKNYTPESKQAGIDWLNNYQKDPVANLYTPPPPLIERNLDMNDAIKLGHAVPTENTVGGYNVTVPNRSAHIAQARTILSQPEFAPLLQQNGVDPHIGDIGGIPNGTGGTIYPTDAPHVNAIADQILQNAAQPHYAATLQAANISPLDPHAKDKLAELIQRQNAGYGKVYSDFANRLDANVEAKKIRNTADERLGLAEERLGLSEERLRMAQEKAAQGTTYVQQLAEKSRNNIVSQFTNGPKAIANPFPELTNLYATNPRYLKAIKPTVNADGTIKVIVPAEYEKAKPNDANANTRGDVIKKQSYEVTFDPNKPDEFKTLFGQLFDQATGEKAGQASKINSVGGKGHIGTGQAPHTKSSDPLGILN